MNELPDRLRPLSLPLDTPLTYTPCFTVSLQQDTFEIAYFSPPVSALEPPVVRLHFSRTFPLLQTPVCEDDPQWLLRCTDATHDNNPIMLIVHNALLAPDSCLRPQRKEFLKRLLRVNRRHCVVSDRPPLEPLTRSPRLPQERSDLCIVCLSTIREVSFEPCNHCLYCETCWHRARQFDNRCSVCRGVVTKCNLVRLI